MWKKQFNTQVKRELWHTAWLTKKRKPYPPLYGCVACDRKDSKTVNDATEPCKDYCAVGGPFYFQRTLVHAKKVCII